MLPRDHFFRSFLEEEIMCRSVHFIRYEPLDLDLVRQQLAITTNVHKLLNPTVPVTVCNFALWVLYRHSSFLYFVLLAYVFFTLLFSLLLLWYFPYFCLFFLLKYGKVILFCKDGFCVFFFFESYSFTWIADILSCYFLN
jgi:hypothetical protein